MIPFSAITIAVIASNTGQRPVIPVKVRVRKEAGRHTSTDRERRFSSDRNPGDTKNQPTGRAPLTLGDQAPWPLGVRCRVSCRPAWLVSPLAQGLSLACLEFRVRDDAPVAQLG